MGAKISKKKPLIGSSSTSFQFQKSEEKLNEERPALEINDHDILGWIEECVEFISHHGLQTEGVFRVCGSVKAINDMKHDFFLGLQPLKSASVDDVYTVSGVLKTLLNELNEPLMPHGEEFTRDQGFRSENDAIVVIEAYLNSLPEERRKCVTSLIQLLHRISENCSVNGMTAGNLGRVLSPTLFRAVTASSLVLLPVLHHTLTQMITLSNLLFSDKQELLDESAEQLISVCESHVTSHMVSHVTKPVEIKISIQSIRSRCHFQRFPVRCPSY